MVIHLQEESRSPRSTGKMPKMLGRMLWLGFEPRYLNLCVSVYNGFVISSIYKKKNHLQEEK